MRRWAVGAAALVTVALGLTGCGKPAGVDGDLINGWALPPEPKIAIPTAPACYSVAAEDPTDVARWPEAVDCGKEHTVETIYVGQFEGEAADRTSPPLAGGTERRQAFGQCTSVAKEYLGADWRTGRLGLFLVLPIELHWDAGARWYRCDVVEYQDFEDYLVASREKSVKGELASGGSLALKCATIKESGGNIDKTFVDCSTQHNGEFVGVYEHPDGTYPTNADARGEADLDGCRGVVASYAGIPNNKDFQYRVGLVVSPFTKAAWELGNRGVRCYAWIPKNITGSVKGIGTSGLPINYA
ncbi:MAG: septum formation family protein [Micromonosporaceae bacterium]|nr:septum formation family protein [Micromonosporaceae bacterium]